MMTPATAATATSPLSGEFVIAASIVVIGGILWSALGEDLRWYVVVVVLATIAAQHNGITQFMNEVSNRISASPSVPPIAP